MSLSRLGLSALAAASLCPTLAAAHGIAGARFFPATVAIDDPAVADELSLPTLGYLEGDAAETGISGEYSKRLTSNFGLSVGTGWVRAKEPGLPAVSGFENLETSAKWQFLTSPSAEAILSAGISVEWGGTGAAGVGAERHTTVTPTVYAGKGFGDLPDSFGWARPFAVTGQLGYAVPTRRRDPGEPEDNPKALIWGATLQYSLPYLQTQVRDLGLPPLLAHMTPIVEASFTSPLTGPDRTTTGTINPGLIWSGQRMQIAAEAQIPVNRASGHGVGAVLQLHFYLDDIFPRSLGRPIW